MGKAIKVRKRIPSPVEALDGPTEAQKANGHYERTDFIHADNAQRVTAFVNRGGTPLARWLAEPGKLTENHKRAIGHCIYLWQKVGCEKSITANYGERIPGTGDSELRAATLIEAKKDLHRIMDYIPRTYWDTFENCIRWDEPAGIAGSKLGFGSRSACDRAHQVVCFVADIIFEKERL